MKSSRALLLLISLSLPGLIYASVIDSDEDLIPALGEDLQSFAERLPEMQKPVAKSSPNVADKQPKAESGEDLGPRNRFEGAIQKPRLRTQPPRSISQRRVERDRIRHVGPTLGRVRDRQRRGDIPPPSGGQLPSPPKKKP